LGPNLSKNHEVELGVSAIPPFLQQIDREKMLDYFVRVTLAQGKTIGARSEHQRGSMSFLEVLTRDTQGYYRERFFVDPESDFYAYARVVTPSLGLGQLSDEIARSVRVLGTEAPASPSATFQGRPVPCHA